MKAIRTLACNFRRDCPGLRALLRRYARTPYQLDPGVTPARHTRTFYQLDPATGHGHRL